MSPAPVADRIDVAPLREAFETSGLSLFEVCRRLDWHATHPSAPYPSMRRTPDVSRLQRALGMRPNQQARTGAHYTSRTIGYDLAVRIAEAIGVDPVDIGA